MKPRRTHSLR